MPGKNRASGRFILSIFILFILSASSIYSQNGKIRGTIIDKATKEPLIGVNVIIDGTTMGAATDIDGTYTILNIPPGTYSVTASMIGYAGVKQQDVQVNIDRTTVINFELQDETVQMEQVVIKAEKPPIVKDQTSTSSNIDDEQLKSAPIEGLRGALDLSAGFQKNEKGTYSVRGSEGHELNFQINGVQQINTNTSSPAGFNVEKADNSWKYDVNPLGVQQLQLITGGFSAEYGNAQAGVVKVVLKEGSPKFSGEFRVEYRPPGQYHYSNYIYDKSNYEWQKWGQLEDWMARRESIINELKLAVRWKDIKDNDPALYEQLVDQEIRWAHQTWVKNHEPGDDNVLGVYDYRDYAYTRYLWGFGGPLGSNPDILKFYFSGEYKANPTRLPTPEKIQRLQNYILNVTYAGIPNHKFKMMGSYQSYVGGIWSGSSDIRWSGLAFTPPGVSTKYLVTVDPVREEQTIAQSLDWVYTIDQNSFLDVMVNHQYEKYELPYKYLSGYGVEVDRLDSLNDPSGTVLREGSWWEKDYFRAPFSFSTNYYQDSRTENWGLKVDYTNQIIPTNLLKAGFNLYYWDMYNNGVNSSFQPNTLVARNGIADYYKAYPFNMAFYIQDKMEYEGMIANIGLRAEMYNFQARVPIDLFSPFYMGTEGPGPLGNPETIDSETKYILLPRLGVSFPIGESTAFRIQYGHFASMPIFAQGLSKRTWVGWQAYGNPNLDPKKTINYEFGLQQVVGENHRMDIVLYYNHRTTQIGTRSIYAYTGSKNSTPIFTADNEPLYPYTTYANNNFGSTVGFEMVFETVTTQNWAYRLSYSLSQTMSGNYDAASVSAEGTETFTTRDFTGKWLAGWDRTHNFRALVQYFFRDGEGPEVFGVKPFENLTMSMTYSAQSGTPFTYYTEFDQRNLLNNRRYPIETSVDFNVTKEIRFDDYKLLFGLRIMNLFDNRWLTPMSTEEDIAYWVEDGITLADPGNDPLRLGYVVAPYRAYRNIPRQIFFTVGFGFN